MKYIVNKAIIYSFIKKLLYTLITSNMLTAVDANSCFIIVVLLYYK